MATRNSLALALASALLPSAQAIEPTEGGTEKLTLVVGGLHVSWHGQTLELKEIGGLGPKQGRVLRSQVVTPTSETSAEFWSTFDKLGGWHWKADYQSPQSSRMDGVKWSLELAHGRQRLSARGYNAFPDNWAEFMAAVEKLASPPGRNW